MWQRLFLQHAKLYLEGSKAPDNEFKDFKNHVLHTRDGYWGGAPEKVRSWYNHLVEALAQQDWPTAVYCAGVLSHYYTDPLQPLHTAQSEAENNIHRAVEWSISKAYDELQGAGRGRVPQHRRRAAAGAQLAGAARLPGRREGQRLLREADRPLRHPARRHRSAGRPRSRGRRLVAELIRYAIQLCRRARPRHRGINVHAPDVSLAAATLAAVAQVPFKLIARRIADKEERRLVERMYDELLATGTVEKHLAEDDRAVRELHAQEVLAKRRRSRRCPRYFHSSRASRSSPASPRSAPPAAARRLERRGPAPPRRRRCAMKTAPIPCAGCSREPPPEGRPHASGWIA